MYQFFVEPDQIKDKTVWIKGNDVNHMKNVLRMKPGEEVAVSNGIDGKEYRCAIRAYMEKEVILDLLFVKEENLELPVKVYLFQGLPKTDKMEFIVQKSVELGVFEIIPVETKRTIVKLDQKKAENKLARWQKISEASAKQSKRGIVPQVKPIMSFAEAIAYAEKMNIKMIPYEMAEDMQVTRSIISGIKKGQDIAVFIGPEGGFSPEEIETAVKAGIQPITLGKRILRTETAGFTVLAFILYQLEE